jgi:hypothetical protein
MHRRHQFCDEFRKKLFQNQNRLAQTPKVANNYWGHPGDGIVDDEDIVDNPIPGAALVKGCWGGNKRNAIAKIWQTWQVGHENNAYYDRL